MGVRAFLPVGVGAGALVRQDAGGPAGAAVGGERETADAAGGVVGGEQPAPRQAEVGGPGAPDADGRAEGARPATVVRKAATVPRSVSLTA